MECKAKNDWTVYLKVLPCQILTETFARYCGSQDIAHQVSQNSPPDTCSFPAAVCRVMREMTMWLCLVFPQHWPSSASESAPFSVDFISPLPASWSSIKIWYNCCKIIFTHIEYKKEKQTLTLHSRKALIFSPSVSLFSYLYILGHFQEHAIQFTKCSNTVFFKSYINTGRRTEWIRFGL